MARRLAEAGHAVTVWNCDRVKAKKLSKFGVAVSAESSEACSNADVAIVMLSNGPVVEEIIFSRDDLGRVPAEAMPRGSVLVVDEFDTGRDMPGSGSATCRA